MNFFNNIQRNRVFAGVWSWDTQPLYLKVIYWMWFKTLKREIMSFLSVSHEANYFSYGSQVAYIFQVSHGLYYT